MVDYNRDMIDFASYIKKRYEIANQFKTNITKELEICRKMANGEPIIEEYGIVKEQRVDLVFDRSSPLVREISGFLNNIFQSSIKKPFTIEPTPISELPDELEIELQEKISADIQELIENGTIDEDIDKYINEQRLLLVKEKNRIATNKAENLSKIIEDKLEETNWRQSITNFINDFCVYNTAILKTPCYTEKMIKKWDGNQFTYEKKIINVIENISPFNIFPSPYATSVEDAEYIIEKRQLTRSQLMALYDNENIDEIALNYVFEEYKSGYDIDYDNEFLDYEGNDIFDLIIYYGKLDGKILSDYGFISDKDDDLINNSYEVEVWVLGDYVLTFQKDASPIHKRPFYTASFYNMNNSFWGKSPMIKLADIQKMITATGRCAVRNMQFASGVITEVNVDSLANPQKKVKAIHPFEVFYTSKVAGQGNALVFHKFPEVYTNLMNTINHLEDQRYEALGTNKSAFGIMQGISATARSTGSVAMIMDRSVQFFKYASITIDKNIIEPVIQSFIEHELLDNNDYNIQGDVEVKCNGMLGLVAKEEKNNKLLEYAVILDKLYNTQDENGQRLINSEAIKRVYYTIFKGSGLDVDKIFEDYDKIDILKNELSADTPSDYDDMLDGRSAIAKQALEKINKVV